MKMLLVNPVRTNDILPKVLRMPPLGLATLASHTPDDYDIEIVDESVQELKVSNDYDIVGITSMTYNAPRAYQIAEDFKAIGVPVIMGGIHPTMVSTEALQYSDAIVTGEAESVWPNLLRDHIRGKLKKKYSGEPIDLAHVRMPRYDLLQKDYQVGVVQASRGCPFSCSFCSVRKFNGSLHRQKPVSLIADEFAQIKNKTIVFADDNLVGYGKAAEQRAIELFGQISQFGKRWSSQTSINVSTNDKLLAAASDSGAASFFIGLESVEDNALKNMNKSLNRTLDYRKCIKNLHDHGISVTGSFILGSDTDTKQSFGRLTDFILGSDIDRAQILISTPLPGTQLYNDLKEQKRLIANDYPNDWSKYDGFSSVFKPMNMTADELEEGLVDVYRDTNNWHSTMKRAYRTIANTKSLFSGLLSCMYNRRYLNAVESRVCN